VGAAMANAFARRLRKNATEAERPLWARLRRQRLDGNRFRRQVPIAGFIADFACHSAKLIIELDGGQHANKVDQDCRRAATIEREGYRVIRFWNNDVFENLEGVLERIREALPEPPS
jgi:very-short-patch-repair endonuclease